MRNSLLLSLLLVGCATQKIVPEPTTVEVPVVKKCAIVIPDEPKWNFDTTTSEDKVTLRVKALMIDRQLSRTYEQQLRDAVGACQ